MSDEIGKLVKRIGELLEPIMYPHRPDAPVIAPYAVMDTCGHVHLSDSRGFVKDAEELDDLCKVNKETRAMILARNPKRSNERAPGCSMCGVERIVRKRMEPLHWRMN